MTEGSSSILYLERCQNASESFLRLAVVRRRDPKVTPSPLHFGLLVFENWDRPLRAVCSAGLAIAFRAQSWSTACTAFARASYQSELR